MELSAKRNGATTLLERSCPSCGVHQDLVIGMRIENFAAQHAAWVGGMLVQHAFPGLSPDQREFIQTGTCPKCWDASTKEPDPLPEMQGPAAPPAPPEEDSDDEPELV